MGKRLSVLLFLVVTFLTVFAFTAGSGSAQTTGTGSAAAATVAPTATRAATVAPTVAATATTATGATAVATGTGGATTTTTLPATGQTRNGSMNAVIIEVMILALAIIGTGVALKRRASRS